MRNLTKKLGRKLAKRMYGIFCAYIFLIFIVLIFMSMSRADTITVIEEVTTTETITEMVEQEVTTTQTVTEIVDQEVEVEVTSEVQVEQVTPDVQESLSLDPLSDWTKSGDASTNASQGSYCTSGQACTGHQGGTFSTDVDFEDIMTISEINNGFDVNYGVTVKSHNSNSTLPLCSQTNGDCKDRFTVTLELTSGSSVVQTFEDTIVLDFGGTRDYTFSESIGTNTYTDLLGTFSLFGIDAGYNRGMYGPIFSDPYMNVVYDQIEMITQQVTNIVTETIQVAVEREIEVIETILVPVEREIEVTTFIETEIEIPDVNEMDGDTNPLEVAELEVLELDEPITLEPDTSFTVEISSDELGSVIESFDVQVEVADTGDMATISIEDIGGEIEVIEIEVEPQVAEVEVEVAAEIEMEVAETTSEPVATVETGEDTPEVEVEVAETKTESVTPSPKSQKIRKQVASAVAKRIMSSIANNYDSTSQATQLALINAIGSPQYQKVSLSDQYSTDWYESTDIYMQDGLSDPYGDAFIDAQGMQMDELINSQY
jgi:hypothetical protein